MNSPDDQQLRQRALEIAMQYMHYYPSSCGVGIAQKFYEFLKGETKFTAEKPKRKKTARRAK